MRWVTEVRRSRMWLSKSKTNTNKRPKVEVAEDGGPVRAREFVQRVKNRARERERVMG